MSDLLVDSGCAAIGGAVALGLLLHLRKRQARRVERRSRPAALRDAELVYIEKTFRTTSPVLIAAKLDRAYRLPSGQLVLVELKTRWNGGPNLSDVIQLSAQRVALSAATGQTVAAEAFVLITRPGLQMGSIDAALDVAHAFQVVRRNPILLKIDRMIIVIVLEPAASDLVAQGEPDVRNPKGIGHDDSVQ